MKFSSLIDSHQPLLLLFGLAIATHILWLDFPRQVVFDEVHFGKFVTAYCCTHERFFDIHPPHAKLLIAGTAYLSGYRGGHDFSHIGQDYGAVSPIPLRLFPAIAGILLVGVFYWLLRELGASEAGAFLGGLFIVFENALTVQTRVIALDGLLLLSTFGALAAYFAAERRMREGSEKFWDYGKFLLLAGALGGLAVGTKFTGLLALGFIGLFVIWRLLQDRKWRVFQHWVKVGLFLLSSAFVVYLVGWVFHFVLLTEPGSGDAWRVPDWEGPLLTRFYEETVELHRIMYDANHGLEAGHHDSSLWWEWPFMTVPVYYWNNPAPEAAEAGKAATIYLLGNPLLWWGAASIFFIRLIGVLFNWLSSTSWRNLWKRIRSFGVLWVPVLGYLLSFGPLTTVPRALFLYHYFTPLLFTFIFVILWMERAGFILRGSIHDQKAHYFMLIGSILAFFVLFSPMTYGINLDSELHTRLFWFESWR